MKQRINLILFFSTLLFLIMCFLIDYSLSKKVGDITFDSAIDNNEFEICSDENAIYQYYSVKTSYAGGRKAIRQTLHQSLKEIEFSRNSGYLTFRFIVNCEGKIGLIRFKEVNRSYKKTSFGDENIAKLKKEIYKLQNWNVGRLKDSTLVDSYYQINFKISNGTVSDIF